MIPSEPTTAIQVDALRENLFGELPFSFSILDASTSSLSKPSAISSQKRIVLEDRQLVKDLFREPVREPQYSSQRTEPKVKHGDEGMIDDDDDERILAETTSLKQLVMI